MRLYLLFSAIVFPQVCFATVLADSVADFSSVQGSGGWTYGYYDKTADPTPATYD